MVLGPKSEERVKELLNEYIEDRRKTLNDQLTSTATGIFLWGFLSGVVMAYTSVWPFLVGLGVGYSLSKKEWPPVENAYRLGENLVTMGYTHVKAILPPQQL